MLAGVSLLSALAAGALHQPRIAAMLVTASLSAILLAVLDHYRHRLAPTALRATADLVLLTPIALVAFGMIR